MTFQIIITTGDAIEKKLDQIIGFLTAAKLSGNQIMNKLDDIAADVQTETALIEQVSTMIRGLQDKLFELLQSGVTEAQVEKIGGILAHIEENKSALAALLAPAPAPVPADENPPAAA